MARGPNPKRLVVDKDSGYAELMTTYRTSKEMAVFVGFLQSSGLYKPKAEDKAREPITLAQIATIHEFGSRDGRHPPQRSFMGAPMDANRDKIDRTILKLLGQVFDQSLSQKGALGKLGEYLKAMFRGAINKGLRPALAPATLARKGSAKFKPLIDTGQLIRSISYEVRAGKKGGS